MLHDDVAKMMRRVSPAEVQAYLNLIGAHQSVIIENAAKMCRWRKSFAHHGLKTLYLGTERGFKRWLREHALQ